MGTPVARVAQGTITERDYIRAQYLHLRPRMPFAILGILMIVGALAMTIAVQSLIMLAILGYFAAYFFIFIPWRAKRNYRQYKALHSTVSYEVRSDGLFAKSEHGEGMHPWNHFHRWRQSKHLFLLYPASNIFVIVPAHFFNATESRAAFTAMLHERVGSAL